MSRATDTQVCLLRVEAPNAADQYVTQYTGAIPLQVKHEGFARPSRIIGPPVETDLCSITRELQPGGGPVFQLHTVVQPTNVLIRADHHTFKMRVTLQARSIEADSNLLRVELTWNGQWAEDTNQMANNFVVTVL